MYPRITYDLPILSMDVVANNDMVSKQFNCWLTGASL